MNRDFVLLQLYRRPDIQEALKQKPGTPKGLEHAQLISSAKQSIGGRRKHPFGQIPDLLRLNTLSVQL
jgi:hypothetical protein